MYELFFFYMVVTLNVIRVTQRMETDDYDYDFDNRCRTPNNNGNLHV